MVDTHGTVALEQAITETLQEMDADFSRANELATTILREAKEYTQTTMAVSDALQEWKDFFGCFAGEAAASRFARPGVEEPEETPAPTSPGPSGPLDEPHTPSLRTTTPHTPATLRARARGVTLADIEGKAGEPMRLFSPPLSTPFYKASRTPGPRSGFETGEKRRGGGGGGGEDDDEVEDGGDVDDEDEDDVPLFGVDDEHGGGSDGDLSDASPELPQLSHRATMLLRRSAVGVRPMGELDKDDEDEGDVSVLGGDGAASFSRMMTPKKKSVGGEGGGDDGAGGMEEVEDEVDEFEDDMLSPELLSPLKTRKSMAPAITPRSALKPSTPFSNSAILRDEVGMQDDDQSEGEDSGEEEEGKEREGDKEGASGELNLSKFPAMFQSGRGAAELQAVWVATGPGDDGKLPFRSAKDVSSIVPEVGVAKAELLLDLLTSRSYLRPTTAADDMYWVRRRK